MIDQQHTTTVLPSTYGAHDPNPIPASVYQSNGIPTSPTAPSPVVAAATTSVQTVTATAYSGTTHASQTVQAAPVVATAYVPGSSPQNPVQAAVFNPNAQVSSGQQVPVQAAVYNPQAASGPTMMPDSTPSYNPSYNANSKRPSFNNGNFNYKTNESSYWECLVCTFPNLRTEANCKGCGSPIPPGLLFSPAAAEASMNPLPQNPVQQMNAQMNSMSLASAPNTATSSTMRVHIPSGMQPGQKIKVRSPDGMEVVKAIPPRGEWLMDGSRPFFRVQFGPTGTPQHSTSTAHEVPASTTMRVHIPSGMQPGQRIKVRSPDGMEVVKVIPTRGEWLMDGSRPFFRVQFGPSGTPQHSSPTAHEVPPPHRISWRQFYPRAPTAYSPPPLGTTPVPYAPLGSPGVPPNGRHKALIIGINYHGTRAQLRGCINDAKSMQNLLKQNGFPDDGSHMLMLTDERDRGGQYQPTKVNIMKAFSWFMQDVRKGDVLFFHFSGHGGQVPDKTGHEADGWNETVIPVDHDRAGQITDDVLFGTLVYKLPEGARLTALMDMCHSGTGLDLPFDYNVDTRRWKDDINPAHSAGDVCLFSGCEDSQTSADVQSGGRAGGAMTMAFTKAYQTAGMCTYHEFLTNVKKQLRKKRYSQRPQLTSSQKFDANSRIFSLGYLSSSGGIPSTIEGNHNPKIGRTKSRHVRPGRQGMDMFGFGGGNTGNVIMAGVGAALLADAFF